MGKSPGRKKDIDKINYSLKYHLQYCVYQDSLLQWSSLRNVLNKRQETQEKGNFE